VHLNSNILNLLDIDSSEFLYKNSVQLYDKTKKQPFGKVKFEGGKYHLIVGDLSLLEPQRYYD